MTIDLVTRTEHRRQVATEALDNSRRSKLGQFFTPSQVASFMAQMIACNPKDRHVRLLDPGAGVGSLSAAAVAHLLSDASCAPQSLHVVAYEIDTCLHESLRQTLEDGAMVAKAKGVTMTWELRGNDYITAVAPAVAAQPGTELEVFDVVIMNPPYRKIKTNSAERVALMSAGLRVSNLYTAFVALAAAQLQSDGVLVAITPRSFANGLYHEPFRRFLLSQVGIERLHVFESRGVVFADADVLQENVIYSLRQGEPADSVILSVSAGGPDDATERVVASSEVIRPDDPHHVWHIPVDHADSAVAQAMRELPSSLVELALSVSTGRVVDFRSREFLSADPASNTVPLIYPVHLRGSRVVWPTAPGGRKANAFVRAPDTEKMLLPNETYVLVRRLTSKEERRRVSAAISSPADLPGDAVAFENHLNVFHQDGRGLEPDVARGLAAFLNSSFVDRYVRAFNGHTQINATDLRRLRYPALHQLRDLGASMPDGIDLPQDELDTAVTRIVPSIRIGDVLPAESADRETALSGSYA
jgi:adenine-specific DNA-methyltransferase